MRSKTLHTSNKEKPQTSPYVVPGRQAVGEALRAGKPIEKILIQHDMKGPALAKIVEEAKKRSIPVIEAGKQRFLELVGDIPTQGVVALLASKEYVSIGEIVAAAEKKGKEPFLLLLDEIEDPQNLGALIRTAECCGVHGVVIPKHHAASFTPTVERTSAGASQHMPAVRVTNFVTVIDDLKKMGFWIYGAAMEGDRAFTEVDYKGKIALVIGSEGKGIRRLVRERCDVLVTIPMFGTIRSLNASVAGALIMYEAAKIRNASRSA